MAMVTARAILPKCAAEVARICAKEPGKFELHCVRLSVRGGTALVEATNGRALMHARYLSDYHEGEGSVLLVGKDFAQALKSGNITGDDVAHVCLLDDGSVRFELPRWTVTVPPRVAGEYPNTSDVIPSTASCKGSESGQPIGMSAGVVGDAMVAGQKAAGGIFASAWRFYANGPDGAARMDCEGGGVGDLRIEIVLVAMPVQLGEEWMAPKPEEKAPAA